MVAEVTAVQADELHFTPTRVISSWEEEVTGIPNGFLGFFRKNEGEIVVVFWS